MALAQKWGPLYVEQVWRDVVSFVRSEVRA